MQYDLINVYLLGILTNALGNDNAAIAQCRQNLLDLENALEDLWKIQENAARTQNEDAKKIKEIKAILKLLNVHYAGLFFRCPKLQNLIDKSFKLIGPWEQNPNEKEHYTAEVGEYLGSLWSHEDRQYAASKIKDMQNFFHAGLLKRAYIRFREKFPCLFHP